eukprot:3734304-Amphidinium_carterae.3
MYVYRTGPLIATSASANRFHSAPYVLRVELDMLHSWVSVSASPVSFYGGISKFFQALFTWQCAGVNTAAQP